MKKYEKVTKTINGVEYTAQFNGFREMYKAMSKIQKNGEVDLEAAADYLFENVIVSPKTDIDDFEDFEELNTVITFGMEVMQGKGNFHKSDKATNKK